MQSSPTDASPITSILDPVSHVIPAAKGPAFDALGPYRWTTQQSSRSSTPKLVRLNAKDKPLSHESAPIRSAPIQIKLTLEALVAASGNASHPGIRTTFSKLLGVIGRIQENSEIAQGIKYLTPQMKGLEYIFSRLSELKGARFTFLEKLDMQIKSLNTEVEKALSRGTSAHFFETYMANLVDNLDQIIHQAIATIHASHSIPDREIAGPSSHIFKGAKSVQIDGGVFNSVAGDQNNFYMDNKQQERFRSLHTVPEAAYNSSAREFAPECLPHTRTKVLDKIHKWVDTEGTLLFWLNGVAGTGKSTIAQTIAKFYDQGESRGASFFFSRDQQQRRETRFLFQTIAYQLGNRHPALKMEISNALEDESILSSTLDYQLQKLILDPINLLRHLFTSPIVVTFDALDECEKQDEEQEHPVTHMIKLLVKKLKDRRLPLKFFVTSRPEEDMRSAFEPSLVGSVTSPFVLHDVEPSEVDYDIGIFVRSELIEIAECNKEVLGGIQWPNPGDQAQLVKVSAGLFIAAATAVKFIRQNDGFIDPQERLDIILQSSSSEFLPNANPFNHLDRMYTQILNSALDDKLLATMIPQLRLIVATIVLGYGRLTIPEIACLLSQKPVWVTRIVGRLRSVFLAPPQGPVLAFHLSFHDYLTARHRCSDERFFIDARHYHGEIARACLQRMISLLKQDICQIGDRSKLNSDLNLDQIAQQYLPGDLQYSCRFWAMHLAECDLDMALLELLEEFTFVHILHWMEALSLMGDLRDGIKLLQMASSRISSFEKFKHMQTLFQRQFLRLVEILHDAERFLLEFFAVINASALHVYHSAFLFTPKQTLLYKSYNALLTNTVEVVNGKEEKWSANLRTIDGHSATIMSVVISDDGNRIISGSRDKTIRIWDGRSGVSLRSLTGHSGWVMSVAISQDGTRVVSGSEDKTVRVWDGLSGVSLRSLKGHSGWVTSVAISHDGSRIISGSYDKTIRIWDAHSDASLSLLTGHSGPIRSVVISRDGTRILSGSHDNTIRIWDGHRGVYLRSLAGHLGPVKSVAISHDGTCIVSGSDDESIRIWDCRSGACLRELKGHSGPIISVAVSLDGTFITSGSSDRTIRIWDSRSGLSLRSLTGHSDWVMSVAISHDGTRIISGSGDNVRIWDAHSDSDASLRSLTEISSPIKSVAMSKDGTRIISSSRDKTIQIWDGLSGTYVRSLTGHSGPVKSLAISHDGTYIISGSDDGTVRVWDGHSSDFLRELIGHSKWVTSVAISHNGKYIISGSEDTTVRIWDGRSGTSLRLLTGHQGAVGSLTISDDENHIISGSRDKTIRIWHAHSGAFLRSLIGHSNSIASVAISHDGTRIISFSFDKTIRIWDVHSGASLHQWHLSSYVNDIQFIDSETAIFCEEGIFYIPQSALPLSPRKMRQLTYNPPQGWVFNGDKRVCWVPPANRGRVHVFSSSVLVIGRHDGNLTILRIHDVPP